MSIFSPLSHSILRILISSSISTHALESLLLGETIPLQRQAMHCPEAPDTKGAAFLLQAFDDCVFQAASFILYLVSWSCCVSCEFSSLMLLAINFATLPWPRAKWVHIFLAGIFSCVFVSYSKSCHDSCNQIPLFYKECLKSKVYVKRLAGKLDTLPDWRFYGYGLFEWEVLNSEFDELYFKKKLDLLDILKIYNGKYKVMVAAKCYINRDHFEYFT